jgi:hypothetical protein
MAEFWLPRWARAARMTSAKVVRHIKWSEDRLGRPGRRRLIDALDRAVSGHVLLYVAF